MIPYEDQIKNKTLREFEPKYTVDDKDRLVQIDETLCPKCKGKDYFGIYDKGKLIKMSCLDCDYEEKIKI